MSKRIRNVSQGLRYIASEGEKICRRSIRNSLKKEARRTRRKALQNLKSTSIRYTARLGKTLGAGMTRDGRGIYISARASKRTQKGMYLNRHKLFKPVLLFIVEGSGPRYTKKGAARGQIDRTKYGGWLQRTRDTEFPRTEANVIDEFENQLERLCKKYGML